MNRKDRMRSLRFQRSLWTFVDLLRAALDTNPPFARSLAISMIDAFEIKGERDIKAFPVKHFRLEGEVNTISDNGATM